MLGFVGVFFLPAIFLLGGAPAIIPLITLILVVMVTPFINPAERKPTRARWTGRVITFASLALILLIGWFVIFMRDVPLLRE